MEASPVHAAIVSFKNVFDDCIGVAEEICLTTIGALHLIFKRHWLRGSHLLA